MIDQLQTVLLGSSSKGQEDGAYVYPWIFGKNGARDFYYGVT